MLISIDTDCISASIVRGKILASDLHGFRLPPPGCLMFRPRSVAWLNAIVPVALLHLLARSSQVSWGDGIRKVLVLSLQMVAARISFAMCLPCSTAAAAGRKERHAGSYVSSTTELASTRQRMSLSCLLLTAGLDDGRLLLCGHPLDTASSVNGRVALCTDLFGTANRIDGHALLVLKPLGVVARTTTRADNDAV